jgi:hypothetical protein
MAQATESVGWDQQPCAFVRYQESRVPVRRRWTWQDPVAPSDGVL